VKQNKPLSFKEAKSEIINRYARCGSSAKSYVASRFVLGNYPSVITCLPDEGCMLDFGCGYGQLSMLMRLTGEREVYGYDYIPERMEVARRAAEGLADTHFLHERENIPDRTWNAVLFYDMLHYMPVKEQDALVTEFAERIVPGGVLVIRDVHRSFGPRYVFNSMQERIMVGAGLTLSKNTRRVWFRNLNEFKPLLASLGFRAELSPPPVYIPYADYLVVAKKSAD
jgi:2-polyprenyl-3-methyl-5-hydroxy-6-metoxy-1,4-benzoquinol methylase